MKLYATTTSERASKGQGGNDYLEININVIDKINPRYKIYLSEKTFMLLDKEERVIFEEDITKELKSNK